MFKKGLVTSIIAFLALAGLAVYIYDKGGISPQDVVMLLLSVGLLAAKDANQSHSKQEVVPELPEDDDEDSPA